MKRDSKQILQIIEANREKIKGFGVRRLGLFGSAARGEATETSDLDFLVELENETFDAYMDLKFFLEKLFNCQVDLVLPDTIKPRLRTSILSETIYATGL
jgi:predicted nucleotidyltransferase